MGLTVSVSDYCCIKLQSDKHQRTLKDCEPLKSGALQVSIVSILYSIILNINYYVACF